MAVSQRSAGTWAVSNATTQTVTIPSGSSGDLMLCVAVVKPYTAAPTINNGWSTLFTYADGEVANGNGAGSVMVAVFYKVHSGSETNPTITWGTTSAPGGAVIVVFQKGATENWEIEALGNHSGWTATQSAVSKAVTTTAAIVTGDLVFALVGIRDDTALMTRATTAISGGPTWSANHVEYPATHFTNTTSNDIAADLGYRVASSSVAAGQTITVTATLSAVETGTVSLFRVNAFTPTTTPTAKLSLAAGSTPAARVGHAVRFRARVQSGVRCTLSIYLKEGASSRSAYAPIEVTTSLADYGFPISNANAAAITDYSNLDVWFSGYSPRGGSVVFEVDQIYLEAPAGSGPPAPPPYTQPMRQLLAH